MNFTLIALLCLSLSANVFLYLFFRKRKVPVHLINNDLQIQLNDYKLKCLNSENKLRESELLARLVRQSPNAIMVMDKDGNIQMINEGFVNMYEYNFDEFIRALGSNYRETSFSADVERRLAYVAEYKRPFRYEALNITKTGRELWTQTALVPLVDENNEITHLVTIDADINERIVKSDQLVFQMEALNNSIDELTRQFDKLETEFSNLFSSMSGLYKFVENTNEILGFIKGISDETRILGFNASIEASRAGEYGKGFRVITNEIIDISEKTIHNIGKIKTIVDSMQEKQNELITKRDGSEHRVVAYTKLISQLKDEVIRIERSISEFKSIA